MKFTYKKIYHVDVPGFYYEGTLWNGENRIAVRTFDSKSELETYWAGINDARCAANALIQSLPISMREEKD